MKRIRFAFLSLVAFAILSVSLSTPLRLAQAQRQGEGGGAAPITYPETKKVDVVDDYFGTKIIDPFRWMEAGLSDPHFLEFIKGQDKATRRILNRLAGPRAKLFARTLKFSRHRT